MKTFFCVAISLLLTRSVFSVDASKPQGFRISAWYWLNSIEKEKWEQDFKSAADTGFTDMVLCWGLDSAAVSLQKENTRLALSLCQKFGMRAYLLMWQPTHNSLPRQAEFQQADNRGNKLAFRVGDFLADEAEWKVRRPGSKVDYGQTKPLPGRYLCDRHDLLRDLAGELHRLKSSY